jgi:hypothetical protein
MRLNTSAGFCFALAALALALPNTSALAFEKPSEAVETPSNLGKVNRESREERAERVAREREERAERVAREREERAERAARERERREYRACSAGRDCGGSRKEPGSMMLVFPAG